MKPGGACQRIEEHCLSRSFDRLRKVAAEMKGAKLISKQQNICLRQIRACFQIHCLNLLAFDQVPSVLALVCASLYALSYRFRGLSSCNPVNVGSDTIPIALFTVVRFATARLRRSRRRIPQDPPEGVSHALLENVGLRD